MRWRVAILVLGMLGGATAQGRDVFVSNLVGNDNYDGPARPDASSSTEGPCRTIKRALEVAAKGDRIVLTKNSGPYHESLTLQAGRHSGVGDRPFTIEGNGAILDGQAAVPPQAWEFQRGNTFKFRPSKMAYHLLYLDGRPAQRREFDKDDRAVPPLNPLEWSLIDRHIYFEVENGKIPADYNLSHTVLPVGITLYEVRFLVIKDLIVQGFQLDGINAHDSVFDATVLNVTSRGNGRSGISIGGASRVTIENCLIGDNGTAQVRTEGQSLTRIVNCDLLENPSPAIKREGGEIQQKPAAKTVLAPTKAIAR